MIISRTPLRISFLGGGTDYPGWFREHGRLRSIEPAHRPGSEKIPYEIIGAIP
jgi:hypothetical protein